MQADRWKKIEELYQAGLALSAGEARRLPGAGLPRRRWMNTWLIARVRYTAILKRFRD
jgi:hypothetical protein